MLPPNDPTPVTPTLPQTFPSPCSCSLITFSTACPCHFCTVIQCLGITSCSCIGVAFTETSRPARGVAADLFCLILRCWLPELLALALLAAVLPPNLARTCDQHAITTRLLAAGAYYRSMHECRSLCCGACGLGEARQDQIAAPSVAPGTTSLRSVCLEGSCRTRLADVL